MICYAFVIEIDIFLNIFISFAMYKKTKHNLKKRYNNTRTTTRGVATGGCEGVSHPPKIFKNRKNSGKLRENLGKLRENSGKLRENSVTSGNICFYFISNKIRAIL